VCQDFLCLSSVPLVLGCAAMNSVTVKVPASTSNLGSGFDTL
jgi:hypothetical protein